MTTRKGQLENATVYFSVNGYKISSCPVLFRRHDDAEKREYLHRVLNVEHATFTPLVFGTNGGVGEECKKFLSELARKISELQGDRYEIVINWLRTRLSMELTRASLLCLRGSRVPFRAYSADDPTLDYLLSTG